MFGGSDNIISNEALNAAITQRAQINRIFKLLVKHVKNGTLDQIFPYKTKGFNNADVYSVTVNIDLEVTYNFVTEEYKFIFIVTHFSEIQQLFSTPVRNGYSNNLNRVVFGIKRDKIDYFVPYPVMSDLFVDHLLYDLKRKVTKLPISRGFRL